MKKILLLLLITVSSALAGDLYYSATYQYCFDSSDGSTVSLRSCNAKELKYQDSLLNSNYKRAMAVLSPSQKKDLKQAQRLWIKYRDANCNTYANLTGGTMDLLNVGGCHIDMTARRAQEIKEIVEMVGG